MMEENKRVGGELGEGEPSSITHLLYHHLILLQA